MGYRADLRRKPGEIRDAIFDFFNTHASEASVPEISQAVAERIKGPVAESSVRSYLRLNTPGEFQRTSRGSYHIRGALGIESRPPVSPHSLPPHFQFGRSKLYLADCFQWLSLQPANSFHGIVCDPPYGLVEYSASQQQKLRAGRGGVWRIPPSFDGHQRSPLPRFTTLNEGDLAALCRFFLDWGRLCLRVLVPGAHVVVASNPLVSHRVSMALAEAGFERRGEIIRLVMTLRGGDRPKNAHDEFPEVSVMARSMWEPWLLFRKPFSGRVQDVLRRWGTGGLRRPSRSKPFGDVIASHPTRPSERKFAPHPSLKPQSFLRPVVRAMLPLGKGLILDPFAGSGSTLAAAESLGYASVGIENDPVFANMAREAIPALRRLRLSNSEYDKPSSDEIGLFPLDRE